jgi:hypothetical protein
MQQQPTVINTGDFLYFAPAGQAFTIPSAGTVSNAAKPDATDPIWTTFGLGTVNKSPTIKRTSKEVKIMQPTTQGTIVPVNILRPQHELTLEVTMNEVSRLSLTGIYKTPLIGLTDTTFYMLTSSSLQGWLKMVRWQNGVPWFTSDWWADLDCEDSMTDPNVITPKFTFTWLNASPTTLNVASI